MNEKSSMKNITIEIFSSIFFVCLLRGLHFISREIIFKNVFFLKNDVTEEEQRWGSKTVAGSGRTLGALK